MAGGLRGHPQAVVACDGQGGRHLARRGGRVRLRFLGTRGGIDVRSERHHRHSSLSIAGADGAVMVDCGRDWRGELERLGPAAIVLSHDGLELALRRPSGDVGFPRRANRSTPGCADRATR